MCSVCMSLAEVSLSLQVVASLQAQLEQRRRDGEQRDRSFQNLTEETEDLRKRLATASARCQALEAQTAQVSGVW